MCRSCVNRRFEGTYRLHLPWRRRRYVPLKRRFTQDLHGATSQKTAFFLRLQLSVRYNLYEIKYHCTEAFTTRQHKQRSLILCTTVYDPGSTLISGTLITNIFKTIPARSQTFTLLTITRVSYLPLFNNYVSYVYKSTHIKVPLRVQNIRVYRPHVRQGPRKK
jgi:hypothetical protein